VAALGDYGELASPLLPCMWGYNELAARLAGRGHPANELYARWIDEYAGAEFAELTAWCRTLTDRAAETSDRRRMTDAFLTSSRYELAFWDASWRKRAAAGRARRSVNEAGEDDSSGRSRLKTPESLQFPRGRTARILPRAGR
jgi:TENA/THI-4/PQQC family